LESVQELQGRFDAILDKGDNRLESLAIQLEGKEYELAAAHAPILAALGSVHILAAASAEAHINQLAKAELSKKYWDCFERMGIKSKWLFFTRIVGRDTFDPEATPYQQLCKLFNRRNALIHYKPRREPWQPPGVPAFLVTLGLSLEAASESIAAVQEAIFELAKLVAKDPPVWIQKPTAGGFFELSFNA
jgi:hypothetical protein